MYTILLVIDIMVAVSMILLILLQRSEGGALGMGGGGGFVTGRGAANLLTRTTAILAAIFFATSLALGALGHRPAPESATGVILPARQAAPENAERVPQTLPEVKIPAPAPQTAPSQAPAPPAQPQPPQSQ